jgi:hypothetical protein
LVAVKDFDWEKLIIVHMLDGTNECRSTFLEDLAYSIGILDSASRFEVMDASTRALGSVNSPEG